MSFTPNSWRKNGGINRTSSHNIVRTPNAINNTLAVTGQIGYDNNGSEPFINTVFDSNIIVNGDASFNSDVFINDTLTVNGDASFNNPVFINDTLTVYGDTSFNSNVIFDGSSSIVFDASTAIYIHGPIYNSGPTHIVYDLSEAASLIITTDNGGGSLPPGTNAALEIQSINSLGGTVLPSLLAYTGGNAYPGDLVFSISYDKVSVGDEFGNSNFNVKGSSYFNGNVGIGTTDPSGVLHISSGPNINGNCQLIIEADTDNSGGYPHELTARPSILFRQDGGNDWSAIGATFNNNIDNSFNNALVLSNSVSGGKGGILFQTDVSNSGYTAAQPRMVIDGDGNIGIGTTTPDHLLTVKTSSTNFDGFILKNEDGFIITKSARDDYKSGYFTAHDASGNRSLLLNGGSERKSFINNGNNFGIGTTSPAATLDVSGDVIVSGNITLGGTVTGFTPIGGIIMWSGSLTANSPTGYTNWKLCDGSTYGSITTPDLKGRFIVGYNPAVTAYNTIGKTGGSESVTLSVAEIPSHSHSFQYGNQTRGGNTSNSSNLENPGDSKTTSSTGGGGSHENRPPYYTLAYIMRIT